MYQLKVRRPGPPWRDDLTLYFDLNDFESLLSFMKSLQDRSNDRLEFAITFD